MSYYKILGVNQNATIEQIKNAYRTLALKYHPDKNPDYRYDSHIRRINKAYDVLIDPHKRDRYDERHMFSKEPMNSNNYSYSRSYSTSTMFNGSKPYVKQEIHVNKNGYKDMYKTEYYIDKGKKEILYESGNRRLVDKKYKLLK